MKQPPKTARQRQTGVALIIIVVAALVGIGVLLVAGLSLTQARLDRDKVTEEALRKAKDALIAYAISQGMDTGGPTPGLLPCPDLNDDGDAESSCGNASGSTFPERRLGRLPWRKLGIEDLRDGYGERLWYAVSSNYKSNTPNNINTTTLGTITLRDPSGSIVYDGRLNDPYNPNSSGAIALIIAPGSPITRQGASTIQDRSCNGGSCDAAGICLSSPASLTAKCNPVNYLDIGLGEDNSNFVDNNLSRTGNSNGFIQGPVIQSGVTLVNDKISAVSYLDIMPQIQKRVAGEVRKCLREYATDSGNFGRYPWPAPACRQATSIVATSPNAWSDYPTVLFGRIPDTSFNDTSSTGMGGGWTGDCNIASNSGWWLNWKLSVFYALAYDYRPGSGAPVNPCGTTSGCLQLQDANGSVIATGKQVAVLVSGHPINVPGVVQVRGGDNDAYPSNYLESSNANLQQMLLGSQPVECSALSPPPPSVACSPRSLCNHVTVASRQNNFNDVVSTFP